MVNSSMRQRTFGFALGCAAVFAGVTGCVGTDGTNVSAPASTVATTPPAGSPKASTPSPTPTLDGCPPDVNLMFEWLKYTPAIVDKIDKSLTGLQEPVCYQGWSMARTVMKNADPVLVLFKMDPDTGKWNPVAVGTDNICDALQVPATTQAKLGPGC